MIWSDQVDEGEKSIETETVRIDTLERRSYYFTGLSPFPGSLSENVNYHFLVS